MKQSNAARLAQDNAIISNFEKLQNAGFDLKNEGTGAHHISVLIPVFGYKVFDLSATAPDKMLLEMLRQAYALGRAEGIDTAERESIENMVAAFPKLDRHIKELAEETVNTVLSQRLSQIL